MRKCFAIGIIASALGGCVAMPELPDNEPRTVGVLADAIQCEIGHAYQAEQLTTDHFANWYATYEITRIGEETRVANANPLEWIVPKNVDKLVLGAGLGANGKSTRNAKVKYSVALAADPSEACARTQAQRNIKVDPKQFRVSEWLNQVSSGEGTAGRQLNTFSYSVTAEVTESAGFKAAFANGNFNGGSELARQVKTTRTVDFAFAKPPEDKIIKVFVTNAPAGSTKQRYGGARPTGTGTTLKIPPSVLEQNNNSLLQLQLDRALDLDR